MVETELSAATCAELRRAAKRGRSLLDLEDDYEIRYGVIKRHIWGHCEHSIDEPPAPIE